MKNLVGTTLNRKKRTVQAFLMIVLLYSVQSLNFASAQSDGLTFRITDHLGEFLAGIFGIVVIILIRQVIVKRRAQAKKEKA